MLQVPGAWSCAVVLPAVSRISSSLHYHDTAAPYLVMRIFNPANPLLRFTVPYPSLCLLASPPVGCFGSASDTMTTVGQSCTSVLEVLTDKMYCVRLLACNAVRYPHKTRQFPNLLWVQKSLAYTCLSDKQQLLFPSQPVYSKALNLHQQLRQLDQCGLLDEGKTCQRIFARMTAHPQGSFADGAAR